MDWRNSYLGLLSSHQHAAICCGVADAQYLLLHSTVSAWWSAVLTADSPNKPLCAVLFRLMSHLLLLCPPAGLRRAELCWACCVGSAATRSLVQSLFERRELQPSILPVGTWVSSSDSQDVSLMPGLNFLGFFLKFIPLHFISYRPRLLFD